MKKLFAVVIIALSLFACKSEKKEVHTEGKTPKVVENNFGLNISESKQSLIENIKSFKDAISENGTLSIFSGVEYPGNTTLMFGNADMGTPLMQENIKVALDLPLKTSMYNHEGKSYIVYNSPSYLQKRYNLSNSVALQKIGAWMSINLGTDDTAESSINYLEGIVEIKSPFDFNTTKDKVRTQIDSTAGAKLIKEIDHKENAKKNGLDMNEATIFIFDLDDVGRTLIKENPSMAIDLPTKVLVYENEEGETMVAYNHPYYLAKRHHLDKDASELKTIDKALGSISTLSTQG